LTGFGSVCLEGLDRIDRIWFCMFGGTWTGWTGLTGFGSVCLEGLDRINRMDRIWFCMFGGLGQD